MRLRHGGTSTGKTDFLSAIACAGTGARGRNPPMATRLVFLVPGFFGFTSVGAVSYFERVEQALGRALGLRATPAVNDGIVPKLSQLHGRVLHVARADHLDVAGHYTLAGGRTADWLPSGAGFTPEAFEATWEAVAAAIARSH